ncbi:MAG TPA: type I phosphomannose isomerase catalytic subunit [Planctomycetota bacterium]|jgi:mannose-6-phosphate isomerase|nr:type I phosphomannose isomerase catalytic subunit [Planctomycetota bacterium]
MAAPPLPPLVFAPLFFERIWGGGGLAEVAGLAPPARPSIGEAWILADREGARSRVREGPFEGRTLRSLIEEYGSSILGAEDSSRPFPLLVKFLDAAGLLSLQVHPDQEAAIREGESDLAKDEAWVFLRLGNRARVYAGLRPEVGRAELERALQSGDPEPCLRRVEVSRGDILPVPAGTVHALGDVVVLEVQTNSDLTYRLSDWGRVGKDGRPRSLHVEKGLRSVRPESRPDPARGTFASMPRFLLECAEGTGIVAGSPRAPTVVVPLRGEGRLRWRGGGSPWSRGEAWLLPAACGETRFEAADGPGAWARATPTEGGAL